jgi:DNA-directed RNA polymerase specialized sigma24 family protein
MARVSSLEVLAGLEPVELDVERLSARREVVEVLRTRLSLLDGADRVLLKMHLDAGSSFDEIAKLTGLNRSSICRRIHRMMGRLADETYVRCAAAQDRFSAPELIVVRDHFVRGLSLKRICREHNLCYYRVRTIVERARRLAQRTKTE